VSELEASLAASEHRASELEARLGASEQSVGSELAEQRERAIASEQRARELEASLGEQRERVGGLERAAAAIEQELAAAHATHAVRVAALESALETARAASTSMAVRLSELEETVNLHETRVEEMERERIAADAEWGEKLQTIVTHLASDHEADLGQALLEKEEARAEARSLTARVSELRRLLEERSVVPEHGFAVVNLAQPKRRTILLIHREAMLRTMAKHALERNGYRVITAADGLEALRVAMIEKPDVILADTQMPKMDGRALVQLLKSRPETANVKIVLIGTPQTVSQNTDFHADDFLRDPANLEALRATIENVLATT
jgi:CheY-like chemotaxis protein